MKSTRCIFHFFSVFSDHLTQVSAADYYAASLVWCCPNRRCSNLQWLAHFPTWCTFMSHIKNLWVGYVWPLTFTVQPTNLELCPSGLSKSFALTWELCINQRNKLFLNGVLQWFITELLLSCRNQTRDRLFNWICSNILVNWCPLVTFNYKTGCEATWVTICV